MFTIHICFPTKTRIFHWPLIAKEPFSAQGESGVRLRRRGNQQEVGTAVVMGIYPDVDVGKSQGSSCVLTIYIYICTYV